MKKLFGTNGVRGVFSEDFTLEFVNDLVMSLAAYFKQGKILVGYDGRHSSPIVAKVVSSALNYSGLDCYMAGLVPTPCLEYATKKLGYDGGLMITASHNPPQYNGIKPVASDGVEISREDERKIEQIFDEKNWIKASTFGKSFEETNVISTYIDGIISLIDIDSIKAKKFKVCLDLGNGAQAVTAKKLCENLGCDVHAINEEINGDFPGRGSEPTPQNLDELSKLVVDTNSNFGIAFDGDGDRSIFCDETGKILTGDSSALLLCDYLLQQYPNSQVVTCLNSGNIIENIVEKTNSRVVRTKVGSVEVSRRMVNDDALVGYEENGGFMFGNHNHVRDGAMTLALMLDLLSKSQLDLSQNIKNLPPSFTTKTKIECSLEKSKIVISELLKEFPDSNTSDGIKIQVDKDNWVMIRPSGTEPIIRIYGESNSQQNLDSLISNFVEKTKSILA
ncbi:MAG: phosphoglucosamine mutase [Thermoproteota archaeon]|jgi:phosphomannomutase/phosphoglucomutase|nr:phosphoglucosamine mutase [Thermoproteota archaeon]